MGLGNRLYWVLGLAVLVGMTGCSNDADPDEPVVLGVPPDTAYLGVEYAYNFGAYGGDDILDFTLVNAPPWMSFEDTANKARTGVILRGVPGITGGRNGEDDLGTYNNISVNVTDGSRLGGNVFDVTVEHNPLAVEDVEYVEGASKLPKAARDVLERAEKSGFDAAEDSVCLPPDMENTGTVSAAVPKKDSSGNLSSSIETYPTRPVLVPITLGQPSVEPVSVAFRLSSSYRETCQADDESRTELTGEACAYNSANQETARVGWDVVASSGSLETPEYLTYKADDPAVGTVTFEPGKTTCFIRLEVINDELPELTEAFRLDLFEIRDGLASFDAPDSDSTAALVIEDDEPFVTFEPESFVLSEGASRTITARLNKVNDTGAPLKVKVIHDEKASSADAADFALGQSGSDNSIIVEIPNGQQETSFLVRALDNPYVAPTDPAKAPPGENIADHEDDILVLKSDVNAQFGRTDYAGSANAKTEVTINEWTRTTTFAQSTGFTPSALAVGDYGELYIVGVQDGVQNEAGAFLDDQVAVYALDRLGRFSSEDGQDTPPSGLIYVIPSGNAEMKAPRLAFSSQTVQGEDEQQLVRTLALGYTVQPGGQISDIPARGGEDVGISYLRDFDTGRGFERLWETQLGSPENDTLVDIALHPSLGIFFGANTESGWDKAEQGYQGAGDFILGQVSSVTESETSQRPQFEWAKLLGTPGADILKANPVSPNGSLFPTGQTTGRFESAEQQFGKSDLFFVNTSAQSVLGNTYQLGSAEADTVADATAMGSSIWAAGSSTVPYRVLPDGSLDSEAGITSQAHPYVLVVSATEGAVSSISLPDANGTASQTVNTIAAQSDFAVIGGSTNGGSFARDAAPAAFRSAILASVSLSDEQPPADPENEEDSVRKMQENWRYQHSTDSTVIDVAISESGKIFALIEDNENAGYSVILFDESGQRLDR